MSATETSHDVAPEAYRLGTGAPAGLWLGLGGTRLGVLAAGLLASVALLAAHIGVPVSLTPLLCAAAGTLTPVAGRPVCGWAAPAAGAATGLLSGSARWRAGLPYAALPAAGGWPAGPRLRLPPECGRLRLTEVSDDARGWPVATLVDRAGRCPVLLFAVAGADRFGLLDPDGQDRLLAGWGRALSILSGRDGGVVHVQLVERVSAGESATGPARTWAAARGAGDDAGDDAARLAALVDTVTARRDSLLAVRLRPAREPGRLAARAEAIAAQLLAADLVARPLSAEEAGRLAARTLTPEAATGSGPVSRRAYWEHVRVDDGWHRSFVVAGWPGSPVPAGWLGPLLLPVPPAGAWTLAVHLRPVPAEQASRIARAARTRADLDRVDRARLGLPASAAADRAVAESAGMDADLVAGHATHRLAAVLTASAGSPRELDEGARALREAASAAGLTVAPLHGQHHLALAATLPLCRLRFGGAR